MNSCESGALYGYASVELLLIGKGRIQMPVKPVKVTPQMLRKYFPRHAREGVKPVRVLNGKFTAPVFAAFNVMLHYRNKLKQCPKCERFFYAPTSRRKFCSQGCQVVFFKSSPEWKTRRRENSRKNRIVNKTRNARALERAKREAAGARNKKAPILRGA